MTQAVTVMSHAVHLPEPEGLPPRMIEVFTRAMQEVENLIESREFQVRFAQIMLTTLRTNAALQQCTPESIVTALVQMCSHNFDPSSANECFLIPYQGRATLQVGYAGLMKLAMSHPDVQDIYAEEVCDNDTYEYYGVNVLPKHIYPAKFAPRGRYIGYYAVALLTERRVRAVQMSIEEVKAHANYYSQNAQNKIWSEARGGAFRSMALKTVLRKICSTRYLPVVGKVASLLRTLDTLEGTIDDAVDEERAQARQVLEVGKTLEDHIEDVTGERPVHGATHTHMSVPPVSTQPARPYTVTPQGAMRHQDAQATGLAIDVQISNLLYAQGFDDAGVAAWWEGQRATNVDLSPGYLNYLFERLQATPGVPPATALSATNAQDAVLATAWRALSHAQERLRWTEQERKLWERKQARRFRKTYAELPLETVRALAKELEALQEAQAGQTTAVPACDDTTEAERVAAHAHRTAPESESAIVSAFDISGDEEAALVLPDVSHTGAQEECRVFESLRDE